MFTERQISTEFCCNLSGNSINLSNMVTDVIRFSALSKLICLLKNIIKVSLYKFIKFLLTNLIMILEMRK